MKTEFKVAWPKSSPVNVSLKRRIQNQNVIRHAEIINAVDDPDNRIVFGGNTTTDRRKEDYVIFQYGVVVRRGDGAVAVFERAAMEQGQKRTTPGHSLLLSASSPDKPVDALPRLLRSQLCVNRRKPIADFSPIGLLWNELPFDDKPRPVYFFALYEHTLPDGVVLHGRFRELPDLFVKWLAPDQLPELGRSGYVDQFLESYLRGVTAPLPNKNMVFAPGAAIKVPKSTRAPVYEYSVGRHVFISHYYKDSFAAYALYRILIDESDRSIFPTVDLVSMQDGDSLSESIQRYVSSCDCLVLIITPTLLTDLDRAAAEQRTLWCQREVEMAQQLGKPIIGFKLGTMKIPSFLGEDMIVNNRAEYCDWIEQIRRLIVNLESRFSPTQSVRSEP